MKKPWHIAVYFVACVIIGVGIAMVIARGGITFPAKVAASLPTLEKPEPKETRLLFLGDMMLDRGVENSVKNNMGGDFARLFENISTTLKEADLVFGNLEGPVTAGGTNVGSRFSFAMDSKILPVLVANNFKMVSFANNHVGDRSNSGFLDTLNNLDTAGLPYVGAGRNFAEASAVKIVMADDLKIGFIACTDVGPDWLAATINNPGILLCSNSKLPEIITAAQNQVDFLIFTAHWGAEYHPKSTRQTTLAHMAIDNGADMVIGHHPHVIQATEWYNGKFIAYSLGNFIFDQYFADETMQGLLVDATIEKHAIKKITLKVVELAKDGNKYQPTEIRDATPIDFITKGVVAAQTCPSANTGGLNRWLDPIGPDLDIGNYVPANLIPLDNRINVKTTASCLIETAANALITMVDEMEKSGLSVIMTSGFRTRGTQDHIHATSADTQAAAIDSTKYPSVALPGRSEHQLGTAVDLKSANDPAFSYDNFKNSPEYAWLAENAWRYGFIQSYQPGTEPITGYMAEAWHFRYVGLEHAKNIRNQGITIYEYLKKLAQ